MIRKFLLLVTALALLSFGMAASAQDMVDWTCGTVDPDTDAAITITGWEGPGEVDKFLLAFDEFFEEYYPNVEQVLNTGVAWGDYWTTLPAQLAGGAEIDMAWMHISRNDTFASNGWLLNLDSYLESCPIPGWPDLFVESMRDAFNYQGSQYAIPYDFATVGVYVNTDLFEEAGLDLPDENTTFEEFQELAIALTQDTDGDGETDVYGVSNLASPGAGAGGIYWIIKSFGGELFNEDITGSELNSPESIAAIQWVADMIWEHGAHPTADAVAASGFGGEFFFANGKSAMHFALNDAASRMWELIGDSFTWSVVPTPRGVAGHFNNAGGSAFSIPVSAAHPDLSYELIRYTLSNPDHLCRTATMGAALVSQMEFHDCAAPPEAPYADVYHDVFSVIGGRDAIFPSYHPRFQEWSSSVWVANMDLLWTGEERDAAVAVQAVHDQTNEMLGG